MIENVMTKRRIFEIYLNIIEWGNGVFGAEAAARYYYDTSAAYLDAEQAARLAAMVPKPRYYDRGALHPAAGAAHRHHPGAHALRGGSLNCYADGQSVLLTANTRKSKKEHKGNRQRTVSAYCQGMRSRLRVLN